jgi:hypothetical protein
MGHETVEEEVQAFSVVIQPRERASGITEVRVMKVEVVLGDKPARTRFFTAEHPCSLGTMLDNVKAVVDALRAEAE